MSEDQTTNNKKSDYPEIISAIRSPLSLFALAMLICNAIFSISAAAMGDIEAFKYAIHTFLSIVGAFIMIAIWSPRSLYHPKDLQGLSNEISEARFPKMVITISLFLIGLSYMGYQVYKIEKSSNKANVAVQLDAEKKSAPAN